METARAAFYQRRDGEICAACFFFFFGGRHLRARFFGITPRTGFERVDRCAVA
jgi:hypothetical protein